MDQNQANEYIVRINTVCQYIDVHLGEEMTLQELARVAGFSEYHFHRIFTAMTGETLFSFITRLRLERAAMQLCMNSGKKVTVIAADCGFSSPAVFSRLFRKHFSCSPSDFRKRNQNQAESNLGQLLRNRGKAEDELRDYNGNKNRRFAMEPTVKIERIEKKRVAYLRYVGPYAGDGALFERLYQRLYAWTNPRGIDVSETYIIYHDDPSITEEQKLRLSLCVPIGPEVAVSGEMCEMSLGGGNYAVGHFKLNTDEYGQAWHFMCEWLPQQGYTFASEPAFERYMSECDTDGSCSVDICIPVVPA